MKAYWWKAGDWVGIAVGRDWEELFMAVDHQTSPADCLYIPATCFCASWSYDCEDEEEFDPEFEVHTDFAPDLDDHRWKSIDWDKKLNPDSASSRIKKLIDVGLMS